MCLAIAVVSPPETARAQARADSAAELARKASDPTESLTALNFKYAGVQDFHGLGGSSDSLQFQPVVPFRAWGTNNILRPTITYDTHGPNGAGLADFTIFDLVVFDASWGRWGIGPVMQMVPARGTGRSTFAIGPAIGGVRSAGKWTWGMFNQNLFGGDTSLSSVQPVIAYQLGRGWSLSSGEAQIAYDWDRGQLVNLPIGMALGKVTAIAGQPVKFAVNPEYNFRDVTGAPRFTVRATFTVLVPGT